MAKFKSLHTVDEFTITNLIIKVKPYIYGDKRSLAEPNCDVQIHADIWVTTAKWKTGHSSKPSMKFYARARVDLDNDLFYESKTGNAIEVVNAALAIEAIQKALDRTEKDEN